MRVAIDTSFLTYPPSGTGTYVRALLDALPRVDPSIEIMPIAHRVSLQREHHWPGRLWSSPKMVRARWQTYESGAAAASVHPHVLHIPTLAAPLVVRCPLVVTVHDVIPYVLDAYRRSRAQRLHLAVQRPTVRRAWIVIVPSASVAQDVEAVLRIPAARIRVIPEATDDRFRPAVDVADAAETVRSLGVRGRYVLHLAGFDVRKNLGSLIEAFAAMLPTLDEPVTLVLAGAPHTGNPLVYPPIEPLIRRLGLADHVVTTGLVTEAQKIALYQAADCYVTPSLAEGFGLTALEAMACGTPTIVAERTSLPEVAGDGALIVEPDRDALAVAMRAVLTQPALSSDLRARAIERASTFSWERTAAATIQAYWAARHGDGDEGSVG